MGGGTDGGGKNLQKMILARTNYKLAATSGKRFLDWAGSRTWMLAISEAVTRMFREPAMERYSSSSPDSSLFVALLNPST
ncbi:MAG: hypothetical protein LBC43_04945 [Bifidobacteriaceae bacterium]|nr:hypothetical protein [Bifidobacteriaceae bacterium]